MSLPSFSSFFAHYPSLPRPTDEATVGDCVFLAGVQPGKADDSLASPFGFSSFSAVSLVVVVVVVVVRRLPPTDSVPRKLLCRL